MRPHPAMTPGRKAWVLALAGVGLVGACGGGEPARAPSEAVAGQDSVTSVAAAAPEAPPERRFLPDEMRRSTRAETFPHDAHRQIDCAVCHQNVQGHTVHADLPCASCHLASASTTVRFLSRDECLACHHSPERGLPCAQCHQQPGVFPVTVQMALGVWPAPRERSLTFDHARHRDLACAQCHNALPRLTPPSCSTCHESHHVEGVRCMSCHTPPPAGAHDVQVHLTCSGSSCHRAPDVEAIATTRQVCLVCHQTQESHEPGGNCIECHRVRPGGGAAEDARTDTARPARGSASG